MNMNVWIIEDDAIDRRMAVESIKKLAAENNWTINIKTKETIVWEEPEDFIPHIVVLDLYNEEVGGQVLRGHSFYVELMKNIPKHSSSYGVSYR